MSRDDSEPAPEEAAMQAPAEEDTDRKKRSIRPWADACGLFDNGVDMSTVLYDPIKAMAKVTDSVIVAFSGGKESVVTLDLCTRYFKNVKAFFMYIVPDLSFQERTMEWYEKRYQIEIMRIPHMDVCEFYHYGSFRPEDPTFPIVSINDIYQYVRLETDKEHFPDDYKKVLNCYPLAAAGVKRWEMYGK